MNDEPSGFRSREHLADWRKLMEAMDERQTPCQSFPDAWFPDILDPTLSGMAFQAVQLCQQCPIIEQCREYGLKHETFGIWGGLNQYNRRNHKAGRKVA